MKRPSFPIIGEAIALLFAQLLQLLCISVCR